MRGRSTLGALGTVALLALSACGAGSGTGDGGGTVTLEVAAAASLTSSFEEIAKAHEEEHEDVSIELQLAGSSDLATQIENGADPDVFASADEATMAKVADAIDGEPTVFATNTLTIITEPGNPEDVSGVEDLEESALDVVVCAPQVPCGSASETLLEQEEVSLTPASEEAKVTDVLTKVTTGEADAGLVYITDATDAGEDVETVEVEGADEVVNSYPIAALADSESTDEARAFVEYVTGPEGRRVLEDQGFGAP